MYKVRYFLLTILAFSNSEKALPAKMTARKKLTQFDFVALQSIPVDIFGREHYGPTENLATD